MEGAWVDVREDHSTRENETNNNTSGHHETAACESYAFVPSAVLHDFADLQKGFRELATQGPPDQHEGEDGTVEEEEEGKPGEIQRDSNAGQ